MKIKKSILTPVIIAFCIMATSLAQDDAERRYLYPVFPNGPGHAMYPGQKPKVEGWAKERVVERLNRGIIARQTPTGEVYVGWRLLETDAANVAFNLYRAIGNDDPVRLNKSPLIVTTDFIDTQPVPGWQSRHWIFWDHGLLRQMINTERTESGFESHITRYNGPAVASGIEGDIRFTADLFGDWREEIITVLPGEIRIYTTTIPAKDRRVTLLQDPVYRSTVAHNSMGYYQSPMTGYYLGEKPDENPRPGAQ